MTTPVPTSASHPGILALHTTDPEGPRGIVCGRYTPAADLRGVNELLGQLNASDRYGDREGVAELLRCYTVGDRPSAAGGPRRVVVAGESAVIGQQHRAGRPWAESWVRFDWLRTYPSFHTLMRALEDPRFRPGAVADFGGGRFTLRQAWWSTPRHDSCGNWTEDLDVSVVRLLFVLAGGGVAIDLGSYDFDDDGYDDAPDRDRLLTHFGLTPDDVVADTADAYACVLSPDGVRVLEELFG